MTSLRPVLVVFSGLPGTGKSTVAKTYVRASGAAFVRVDTIEQTLIRHSELQQPLGPVGYELGYALATEQLLAGTPVVVAECVNPLRVTREAWRHAASVADAAIIEAELICSDPDEHRRRVETRLADIPGLRLPTWWDVENREYEVWDRERLLLDTAQCGPEESAELVANRVEQARVTA